MATQPMPVADPVTLPEDVHSKLLELAKEQNITVSEALAQAINISALVVRKKAEPGTKVLFKRGDQYEQLVLGTDKG